VPDKLVSTIYDRLPQPLPAVLALTVPSRLPQEVTQGVTPPANEPDTV